jgi:hypothetical protein
MGVEREGDGLEREGWRGRMEVVKQEGGVTWKNGG